MKRDFYYFANFFLGLSVVAGLFQSIIYFWLGSQVFSLHSLRDWFLGVNLISVIGGIFILQYYYHQQYWLTLVTGILATLASLFSVFIIYTMRQFEGYYIPSMLFMFITGIIYAGSLIFSVVGKTWLKAAGFLSLLLSLISLSTLIWGMNFEYGPLIGTFEQVNQWVSVASSFVPGLFMVHFFSEQKVFPTEKINANQQKYSENFWGLLGLLALGFTLIFGLKLVGQGLRINEVPLRVKTLAQQFEARAFVSHQGDTLHYRLLKPLTYDSAQQYPLVVSLHGGAGWGTDNMRQVDGVDYFLMAEANREKHPAFLFLPQIPPGTSWGGIPGLVAKDSLVFEALRALEQEFKIDAKRRYVLGHSLGGYGAWHFICARPEMFAAAMPFSGEGNPELAKNIIVVPVWAFHGRKDRNVPVSGSRDMIMAMRKAGGNPRYSEFPDAGHGIWEEIAQTPNVIDWLFAQHRE